MTKDIFVDRKLKYSKDECYDILTEKNSHLFCMARGAVIVEEIKEEKKDLSEAFKDFSPKKKVVKKKAKKKAKKVSSK